MRRLPDRQKNYLEPKKGCRCRLNAGCYFGSIASVGVKRRQVGVSPVSGCRRALGKYACKRPESGQRRSRPPFPLTLALSGIFFFGGCAEDVKYTSKPRVRGCEQFAPLVTGGVACGRHFSSMWTLHVRRGLSAEGRPGSTNFLQQLQCIGQMTKK